MNESSIQTMIYSRVYFALATLIVPLNLIGCIVCRYRYKPNTIAHIGEMRPLLQRLVDALKVQNIEATYFAVGSNKQWCLADYHLPKIKNPIIALIRDTYIFWRYVSRHEVVHMHCGMGISPYLHEPIFLKLMGRRIVVHIRGCEGRDRFQNMSMNPDCNICQACDYAPLYLCMSRQSRRRKWVANHLADAIIVTTPDLLDFWPDAQFIPLLVPEMNFLNEKKPQWQGRNQEPFNIVHVTNQPGIEGTEEIISQIDNLRKRGWNIIFTHITGLPYHEVLEQLVNADLSIGKLKMGYYANAQIESMALGIPTITWVRNDLMNDKLKTGGFVFSTLDQLHETLENLLADPTILEHAARESCTTINRIHGDITIVRSLCKIYDRLFENVMTSKSIR